MFRISDFHVLIIVSDSVLRISNLFIISFLEEISYMTGENDIVLIYFEDKPLVFARIEDITEDYKPGWNHVKLLLLQVPLQSVTWILRNAYIDGDPFTMDGKKVRLEKIICPEDPEEKVPDAEAATESRPAPGTKVISFSDFKKK
jgi:hypothetical protein